MGPGRSNALGLPDLLSHTTAATSAVFDDPNLVSSAGLVPALALAERAGLRELADAHLSVPTDKGSNAGLKVASLVAGMVAGADSIEDMALLRHGGMGRVFAHAYAPSTLGGSCGRSGSVTSASSTRSRRGSWPGWPTGHRWSARRPSTATCWSTSTTRSSRSTGMPRAPDSTTPGSWAQRAAGHGDDDRDRAGGSGPAVAEGSCGSPRSAQRLVGDALRTYAPCRRRSRWSARNRIEAKTRAGERPVYPLLAGAVAQRASPACGRGQRPGVPR